MELLKYGQSTEADVYLEDKTLLGISKEFSIPEVETTQMEHETLGSVGVLKLPRRGLSALEGSITLQFPEPTLVSKFSHPTKAVVFQVHQKLDVFNSFGLDTEKSTTLITHVRAMFSKNAFASVKKGESLEDTGDFSAFYLMQRTTDSETPLVEIDLFANIYKVNGENVWPD